MAAHCCCSGRENASAREISTWNGSSVKLFRTKKNKHLETHGNGNVVTAQPKRVNVVGSFQRIEQLLHLLRFHFQPPSNIAIQISQKRAMNNLFLRSEKEKPQEQEKKHRNLNASVGRSKLLAGQRESSDVSSKTSRVPSFIAHQTAQIPFSRSQPCRRLADKKRQNGTQKSQIFSKT
jgi:hypothetical protein